MMMEERKHDSLFLIIWEIEDTTIMKQEYSIHQTSVCIQHASDNIYCIRKTFAPLYSTKIVIELHYFSTLKIGT